MNADKQDPKAISEELKKCRENARNKVLAYIEEENLGNKQLSDAIGLSPSFISRVIFKRPDAKGNVRDFAMDPNAFIKLCYYVMCQSCDSLLFDKSKPILVPRYLNGVISNLEELEDSSRNEILEYVKNVYNSTKSEETPEPDAHGMIRKRIKELSETKFCKEDKVLNEYKPSHIVETVWRRVILNEDYSVTLPILMQFSHLTNIPVDYFVIQDYTAYNEISYMWEDTERIIYNDNTIKILSFYLKMEEYAQEIVLAELVRKVCF